MMPRASDGVVGRAGEGVPRRASLRLLGGAALATVVTPAATVAGKAGKKSKKRCPRQREMCRTDVVARCQGFSSCEEALLPCCEPLALCNGAAAVACILFAEEE